MFLFLYLKIKYIIKIVIRYKKKSKYTIKKSSICNTNLLIIMYGNTSQNIKIVNH